MRDPTSRTGIDWAVARRPLPGEDVSGDLHLVQPHPDGYLLAAVDGVGHGPEATRAAEAALKTLQSMPQESLHAMANRCHLALKNTRGVVMTLAAVNVWEETLTWLGIGNVDGILFRAAPDVTPPTEHVLLRGGVVGAQLPALYAGVISLGRGDLLVLATDGIRSGFEEAMITQGPPQAIADYVMNRHFKGTDDALVLVARYHGRKR
jgi:phosphoserine phosphatase RsbX